MIPFFTNVVDPGDAGAIKTRENAAKVNIVTAGAETRTLPDPIDDGQLLLLNMKTDGGNAVITAASAINATGNNTITFADVTDTLLLMSVSSGSAFKWRVISSDGAALSTV